MTTEPLTIDAIDMNELISKLAPSDRKRFCYDSKSPEVLAFIAQSALLDSDLALAILSNPNTPYSVTTSIHQKFLMKCYLTRSAIARVTNDKCLLIKLLQDSSWTVTQAAEKRLKELLSLV